MPQKKQVSTRKFVRVTRVLIGLVVLGVLLAGSGFTFAASRESHDPFCASCHTQPESTFFQRSVDAQAVDLASFHKVHETRCIDCHSGPGIFGRMQAELLGARNAFAWYSQTAVQPAPQTVPILDATCLKCHQDVTQRGYVPKQQVTVIGTGRRGGEAGSNHWHELMQRWQEIDPNAESCISCHSGHLTDGTPEAGFENPETTRAVCEACHRIAGD